MRIAVLGIKTMPARAGADRVAERLLEHLSEHEHVVYVLRGGAGPEPAPNRRYVRIPALPGKHLRAFSYFLLCALHFAVRGGAEVAHVHNSDFGLFCPLLRLRRGVRVVGTFHGTHRGEREREKWGATARTFLRVSERVFVRSCHALTSVAPLEAERPVLHVPNGVDAWAPPPGGSAFPYDRLGLAKGGYALFACGRLDRTKGLHHLLAAYASLEQAPPLLVVGDFSHDAGYTVAIEDQAARDGRVVLHRGLLDRDTLFDVLAGAAVFVLPSEFEAMSMVLLEAIAAGALVVCSDIPENRAVVGDSYPLLFRSEDAADLAIALARALAGGAQVDVAWAALAAARSRFPWARIAADYEAVYRGDAPESPAASAAHAPAGDEATV